MIQRRAPNARRRIPSARGPNSGRLPLHGIDPQKSLFPEVPKTGRKALTDFRKA
jgi:hypothetical protein